MSEIDFIDIFPETKPADHTSKQDSMGNYAFEDQDSAPGERIKINDYKHSASFHHRGGASMIQEPSMKEAEYTPVKKEKKALALTDEKIVWAGAIFVFFGVFVFLIGYWLGKTTMKNVAVTSEQYITQMDEKIHAQEMESQYMKNNTPNSAGVDVLKPAIPQVTPPPAVIDDSAKKETVAPPAIEEVKKPTIQKEETPKPVEKPKQDTVKAETPAVKPQDTKKPAVVAVAGNFTIQVSAHTSIEKARVIENELRNMGYQAYIVESIVNGVRYYRVRIGKFTDKNDASDVLSKLKQTAIGKDSYIINMN
ncbi:MAG: hypothetical protein A2Y33_15020 [Spirochaetes bacterium GWF1_51_8]|nr:MAG: hypothetical protein A2Y33_15020 [Spirochaetes bacterium GWF1_51_8]